MVPSAATPATAEPEISAKNIEAPIVTIDSPPRMKPKQAEVKAISRREMLDAFMMRAGEDEQRDRQQRKAGGALEHDQRHVRQHCPGPG